MSVRQVYTTAVLMHFVITPTDPSIAHANQDTQEMDKTAQVIFFLVFDLLAWHQNFFGCLFVGFFLLYFLNNLLLNFETIKDRQDIL